MTIFSPLLGLPLLGNKDVFSNGSAFGKGTLIPGDTSRKDRDQSVIQDFRNIFTKGITQACRSQIRERLG